MQLNFAHTIIRKIIFLFAVAIAIVISLYILYQFSAIPNKSPNGFVRKLAKFSPLEPTKQAFISEPINRICGTTNGGIYFTVPNPNWLIKLDMNLNVLDTITVGLKKVHSIEGSYNTVVDSPNIYVFANNIPAIFISHTEKKQVDTINCFSRIFTRSILLSPSNAIFRSFDYNNSKQEFVKINLRNCNIQKREYLINTQQWGGFDSDGILTFDKQSSKIFYIEYYKNRFFCLDTNLSVLYTGNTIDTNASNKVYIKEINIEGDSYITPANPRIQINEDCSISNGILYIHSNLKADNESNRAFNNNNVIDTYDISSGQYRESFYIPKINRENLRSFVFRQNRLICLFKTYVAIFELP